METRFSVGRLPRIEFGANAISRLPDLIRRFGKRALLVTGASSFQTGRHWSALLESLGNAGIAHALVHVDGEPSPEFVDGMVAEWRAYGPDVVVGIGGGSALDAGKAIAGLLLPGNSVLDHLEGVGPELPYVGPSVPFIAVPTTAGTGSEATKNAVLSRRGKDGFKKSFRDERLVAEYAVVDPDLLDSCPPAVLAANGMDALTQLLESYVSAKANPLTDALAVSGIALVRDSLLPWYQEPPGSDHCRAGMAYAALLSGITLAQVGLGAVHGLAAPLGAFFPIPHGVACGILVAAATRVNIDALGERAPGHPALDKYAATGRLLTGATGSDADSRAALVELLEDWSKRLALPRLGIYGVTEADLPRLVRNSRGSSMKTNPIVLSDAEVAEILANCL